MRPAFERVKRGAHRDIRRPRNASIRAVRIEQLRIGVVCIVPRVVPDSVEASVRRYCKRAEPMPLIRSGIVVDPVRHTEG